MTTRTPKSPEHVGRGGGQRRRLYKTVVTVEILSEDNHVNENWNLEAIGREIDTGSMVGEVSVARPICLTGKQMADELTAMGSEPGFFQLNDKGRKVG